LSEPARRGVLITRQAQGARRTASLVTECGYDPVVAPFLVIERCQPKLTRAVQAVLVTSGNAIPALSAWDVPVFTVGDATAHAARKAGFTDVRSAGRDAPALVALVTGALDPAAGSLLLLSGARQGLEVAASLRARGFRVQRRVAYAAIAPKNFPAAAEAALRAGTLHAAVFLSAETAQHFVKLLPPDLRPLLRNILALAIGKKAADALNPLPWRQVRLARSPTLDDVLAQL